jgi:CRISPR-associated protein Cas2
MVVITLENVSRSLRGELTRWFVEVDTGVFVGRVSSRVRELLWEKVLEKSDEGRCTMAWTANNEQGFRIRMHGQDDREVVEIDGVALVAVRNAKWNEVWHQHRRRLERTGIAPGGRPPEDDAKETPDTSLGVDE